MNSSQNLQIPSFISIPAYKRIHMKSTKTSDFMKLWGSFKQLNETSLGEIDDYPPKFKISTRFELNCTKKSLFQQSLHPKNKQIFKKSKQIDPLKNSKKNFIFETLNNREILLKFDPDCPGVFTLKSIQETKKSSSRNPGSPGVVIQDQLKK